MMAGSDSNDFQPGEDFARELDAGDPLAPYRDRFWIPRRADGADVVYLAGNSLGLQPKSVREMIEGELDDWARLGVDGHFDGRRPWYSYHEMFREPGARLVGGRPGEVVFMNSLTVNLHLMMVTFYQPTKDRYKIVMEDAAFPSDTYAIKSQLAFHGIDSADGLVVVKPRAGEHTIRTGDFVAAIENDGDRIALVLPAGVNFLTGQVFDMKQITAAAKARGCVVGWDLAHAVGNVPIELHDWDVDFAVWCSYKYLNSGAGAVAGCFVHERHGQNTDLVRFAGWWGNDPDTRFKMHLQPEFIPRVGADGWQISNPPILAMAPVKASIDIFDEATIPALRAKSERMAAYLRFLLNRLPSCGLHPARTFDRIEVITPDVPSDRGCQCSILSHDRPKERFKALQAEGVVCDFREPNVIRAAPVPLYNTYHDIWVFANELSGRP